MMQIAEVLGVPIFSLFDGSATAGRPEPLDSALSLLAKPHSLRLVQAFDRLPKDGTRVAIVPRSAPRWVREALTMKQGKCRQRELKGSD
jgi:hypothetical protein